MDIVEQRFWRDMWHEADPGVAAERGVRVERRGPVQATLIESLPEAAFMNLVLGAAEPGAVSDGHLAAAVESADSLGVAYYVPVTPGREESEAAATWLRDAGLVEGYAWMKFVRDASAPEISEPEGIEISEVQAGDGDAFGSIAAAGFGLPEWVASLFAGLPGKEGWHCYLASVEGRPAGCAAMLVEGRTAEFGLAATRDWARGRGCQQALLRRRIADASALGCERLFVETGERVADKPSGSYRNILRAGFEEAYLRPNWRRPD